VEILANADTDSDTGRIVPRPRCLASAKCIFYINPGVTRISHVYARKENIVISFIGFSYVFKLRCRATCLCTFTYNVSVSYSAA